MLVQGPPRHHRQPLNLYMGSSHIIAELDMGWVQSVHPSSMGWVGLGRDGSNFLDFLCRVGLGPENKKDEVKATRVEYKLLIF